ncbi:phosphoserine phosphatase [Erysipelothrix larvae]|uniref:Phosphoserine phosphatase n=1 Tax=Erysipelothrix larvae TaxID=1514105 RepID=A0A0X8GY02_9FIRM|nr:HAD-IB family phosphatase [Erysipelothrix larvae]AMC92501.1 phosphoserine phosphatase [Erysipelothrix larvae]
MNVYDFDETIYHGDSSVDFYKFNLKKNPGLAKYWGAQIKAGADFKRGKISKTAMKTIFYRYFNSLENHEALILEFWDAHRHNIKDWYLEQRSDDDVIVSASPEFLLAPICKELNIHLIGSIVNPYTGEHLKENCYGDEKVKRFSEHFNLEDMDQFYSDSYSDDPLAQYAKEAFLVKDDEIKPW